MKNKKNNDLPAAELEKKLRDNRAELLQLRLRKHTGQLEKPHLLTSIRRDIARIETVLHKKKSVSAS
ncbi:MAG: 50S ribosomal protein L29 [Verrucomicrobiota bacterium]|nr:50S ribosomal protein L29 [Verrucomicrobiota bacterium]